MKITLISPLPHLDTVGLRILSACLRKKGHDVQMLFLRKDSSDPYSSLVMDQTVGLSKESGLIGITTFTNYYENAAQITDYLKKFIPTTPIVWGGIHATIRPEECLKHADIVCLGEGEDSVVELAQKIEQGQNYHDVKSMWFKHQGNIVRNGFHPLQVHLDEIPFPDYDFENHFVLTQGKIARMDLALTKKYVGRECDYMAMATRGCPYGCTYCCNNTFHKMDDKYRLVRKRSPANVVQELVEVKKKLPFVRSIRFNDDALFLYSEKDIQEFCEDYKKRVALPLVIRGINPRSCSRAKLAMLVDAGLNGLRMGIETGSERTRALYKRKESNETIINAVNIINEFGDRVGAAQYDIILDNPWETDDDLAETLMLLVSLKAPYHLALFSLTFYPATELYDKAKKDGLIKDDLIDVYRKMPRSVKKTYMNNLFHLLNMYANRGHQLSPALMSVLTKRSIVSYVLCGVLISERKLLRVYELVSKGVRDLTKGDVTRFRHWFGKIFRFEN